LAGLFIWLLCSGPAAAAEVPWNKHPGEQIFSRQLVGVERVDGRLKLRWNRKKLDALAPDFTMSDCGVELAPTEANLRRMIGKPCYAWGVVLWKEMVLNRLEFQCR
jgi:hypothetical protein